MPIALRHLARRKGLGYLPDKPDRRDRVFGALMGARVLVPTSLQLPVPFALDQGGTSSCVAHALAHAIGCREAVKGDPAPAVPSRAWMYYKSRVEHGMQTEDRGTYLRTACDALRRQGAPDEAYWPWKPVTRLHTAPGLEATSHAAGRRGGVYQRVQSYGDQRLRDLQLALAQGMPVCFGADLAASYLRQSGPEVIAAPTPGEAMAGGHAQALTGYRTTAGGIEFRVQNSWGADWRDGGCAWLTESFMARARDIWVVDTFKAVR
jgi:hypothetical protein